MNDDRTSSPPTASDDEAATCDCCERVVARVRSSMWHGKARICLACFFVWYDPSEDIDVTDPAQIKAAVLRAEAVGKYPFPSTKPGIARIAP